MAVMSAKPMHNFEIKWLQPSDLTCDHAFLKVVKPSETGVVFHLCDMSTAQVLFEQFHRGIYSLSGAVAPLASIWSLRRIGNNMCRCDYIFAFFLLMIKNIRYPAAACICEEHKQPIPSGICQLSWLN